MSSILESFMIGIASGLVSSIIVTVYYRNKDMERDRQNLFLEIRKYQRQLITMDYSDVKAVSDFIGENELPSIHKWIKLKPNEKKIVKEFNELVLQIQEQAFKCQYQKIAISQNNRPKEDEGIPHEEQGDFESYRRRVLIMSSEILRLGRKDS